MSVVYAKPVPFLNDALIAATALEHKLVLATGNGKHFKMIAGLKIKPFTLD
jgi:predicted nucleic acid-binding protein